MHKVSVMIPTYNYGHFLSEAIQSVLDQTYRDFELIIVDDGSTDNTKEVVSSFKDARIRYLWQENRGVAAAENLALRAATGVYITDMGADDIYLPQNLEIKVKLLDSRPELGLVYSDAYFFNNKTGATLGRLWRDPLGSHPWIDPVIAARQPLKEVLRRGCFIQIQTSLIRRQVFEAIGYLDESLITYEDWELMVRILKRFPCEMIDTPLVKCRRHANNISDNEEKMYLGGVIAGSKVLRRCSLTQDERRILKDRWQPQHVPFVRKALLDCRETEVRKALRAALQLDPWNTKLYVYLVFSILGNGSYVKVRNWRKNLRS